MSGQIVGEVATCNVRLKSDRLQFGDGSQLVELGITKVGRY
jgi:hypothetical protein